MEEEKRVKPLIAVGAVWRRTSPNRYPDLLRVPMEDGHVVTYRLEIQQPHPCFSPALEFIQNLPLGSYKHKETP